jgi:hypothetical protein
VERGDSFADIARREAKAERHIRHLAPLAFVSPRIITAIVDGTAPAGLTTTALAAGLPFSWSAQEERFDIRPRPSPIFNSPLAEARACEIESN